MHRPLGPNPTPNVFSIRKLQRFAAPFLLVAAWAILVVPSGMAVGGSGGQGADAASPSAASPDGVIPPVAPRTPEETLRGIRVPEGFRVELIAAEPLVIDPVAIDWGPDGKLWVAEMSDYPSGIGPDGKPGGRIRFLEDADGDGQYDRSTVLLDGVRFPTGVMAWRNGVLVTAAPEIFYAEDTDGDGRADVRETLFSGFFEGNQQLRINGLRWGLDNWIYCANGSHYAGYGGQIEIRAERLGTSVPLGSRDFRIRPDEGRIEPVSGPSQFGRNRDDWGNWFGVQNSMPLWHYVLDEAHLHRNPQLAAPDVRRQLLPQHAKVYPAKVPEKRYHGFDHAGHYTSACSAMVYRDQVLFRDNYTHAFTCEPFHNLVQHHVLMDEGVSFTARRDPRERDTDFFASDDRWCRPVMVRTGPEGALWVVDMYRYMIEHPEWLPPPGRDELRPHYRAGDDRGRIYRVLPDSMPSVPAVPRPMAGHSGNELLAELASSNGWRRDLAQRLLVLRRDVSLTPQLQHIAMSHEKPLARLHALCCLDGMAALSEEVLADALSDPQPAIRRHAVRLSEGLAKEHPRLADIIVGMAGDPDRKVQLQVALALGELAHRGSAMALARILHGADDAHLAAAAMSSLSRESFNAVVEHLLQQGVTEANAATVAKLAELALKMEQVGAARRILAELSLGKRSSYAVWQYRAVADVLDTGDGRQSNSPWYAESGHLKQQLADIQQRAREVVFDTDQDLDRRRAAVRLLGREADRRASDFQSLAELLVPQTPAMLQQDIVQHVLRYPSRESAELLLAGWPHLGPTARSAILASLPRRPDGIRALLDHIERGVVSVHEIDAVTRQRLRDQSESELRRRIATLLDEPNRADGAALVAEYLEKVPADGDIPSGAALFRTHCATCHRLEDVGFDVGPSLKSLTSRSREALITAILDPNQAVEPKYTNYLVVTADGLSFSGIVASESGNSITLLGPEAKQEVILRSDLEIMQSTGKSLMPEGLERELDPQRMADLLAYIQRALEGAP